MTELFKLVGKIVIDGADKAKRDIKGISDSAEDMSDQLGKSGGAATSASGLMVGGFKKIALAAASFLAVDKIVDFGKACVEAAAQVKAATAQFDAAFDDSKNGIDGFSDSAKERFKEIGKETGILATRLQSVGTGAFSQFKGAGLDAAEALERTSEYTRLAADAAAYYDMSLEEADSLMRSFIRGNTEAGDRIGLFTSETQRNEAALDKLGKKYNECTEAEKQMIMLDIASEIYESSGAMGQASREADGYENVMGNLKEAWKQFQAVLGSPVLQVVIPIVKSLTNGLTRMTEKVKEGFEWIKEASKEVKAFGDSIKDKLSPYIDEAQEKFNQFKEWISPLIAEVLQPLKGIFSDAGNAAGELGNKVAELFQPFSEIGEYLSGVFSSKLEDAKGKFETVKSTVQNFIEEALEKLAEKLEKAREFLQKVSDVASELIENMKPLASTIKDNLLDSLQKLDKPLGTIKDAFKNVSDTVMQHLLPALKDFLLPLWEELKEPLLFVAQIAGGALVTAFGLAVGAINGIVSALSGFVEMISGIVDVVAGVFDLIVGIFTGNADLCNQAIDGIVEGTKTAFGGLWDGVVGFLEGFVEGVVGFFEGLWDTLVGHSIVPDTIDGVIDAFSGLWDGVSGFVGDFVGNVVDKFTELKDNAVDKAGELKDKAVEKFENLKNGAGEKWENLKSTVSEKATGLKDTAVDLFGKLKNAVTGESSETEKNASGSFKSLASESGKQFGSAKDKAANAFGIMKSLLSKDSTSMLQSISISFTKIAVTIQDVMSKGVAYMTSGIASMRSKLKFNWSLPKLKMPHFNISGGFSLNPPSVPKFSVSWYKKAMQNAMILDNPTIFGYSAKSGKMLGAGDAGNEVVAGEAHLMNMIQNAVAAQNEALVVYMERLIEMLGIFFPEVIEGMGRQLVLDSGVLVGELAEPINEALGRLSNRKDRGR